MRAQAPVLAHLTALIANRSEWKELEALTDEEGTYRATMVGGVVEDTIKAQAQDVLALHGFYCTFHHHQSPDDDESTSFTIIKLRKRKSVNKPLPP